MKQKMIGQSMPIAAICINKSRLKVYNKDNDPTFYLEKNQEFQIELFNPTSDTILAKIQLNGNQISQGGLVLRPGERVFLERYLDVAKKFKFDTYEVENTAEVQKAIENNGDFKVDFYKELQPIYQYRPTITISSTPIVRSFGSTSNSTNTVNLTTLNGSSSTNTAYLGNLTSISASAGEFYSSNITTNSLSFSDETAAPTKSLKARSRKTIETGRVEAGSNSNQKLEYVSKSFDYWPFHTVEYKLLPISQKVNSVADINVKRYCTNCGHKLGKTDRFCSNCGEKV